jgi:hypothetical protein|tara:strand:+ start:1203 stop:1736 length:534 start_codon:yes stop_codon:yes gene_type:complete
MEWRKKKTNDIRTRRVPSHLNTQTRDPAFIKISKISEDCLDGINSANVSNRVAIYHDTMIAYFAREGVALLRRMLLTKKLCDIILQEHCRVVGFVQRVCVSNKVDDIDNILQLLLNVKACYPTSSKHRNAPSAARKMLEFELERGELIRKERKAFKRMIEDEGHSIVEWTEDEFDDF